MMTMMAMEGESGGYYANDDDGIVDGDDCVGVPVILTMEFV